MNARLEVRDAQNAKRLTIFRNLQNKQKINGIQEHGTSSAEKDDWPPNTIPSMSQMINSTRSTNMDGPGVFTLIALVNIRPIKFILDSGSPVTLILKSQFNKSTPMRPFETEYRDGNDNRIKFGGKTMAKVEIDWKQKRLVIMVTTKKRTP